MNRKIKILIIEDDPYLLNMYTTKLELEGFDIASAINGEDGLRKVSDEMPDLILLDIMLPEMNGFEVLENIKKNHEQKFKK